MYFTFDKYYIYFRTKGFSKKDSFIKAVAFFDKQVNCFDEHFFTLDI